MWQGSKWQVFDGESDEVVCTVKEDKLDLKVFRAFNSQAQNQPDYKTKTNNMSLCVPWSLVILHGKEPLAEVCVQKNPLSIKLFGFATQEPKHTTIFHTEEMLPTKLTITSNHEHNLTQLLFSSIICKDHLFFWGQ
jgi:hypothetical protein